LAHQWWSPSAEGLFEVRSTASDGDDYRVLFCIVRGTMILLHGYKKLTKKLPLDDLKLARSRQSLVEAAERAARKKGGRK